MKAISSPTSVFLCSPHLRSGSETRAFYSRSPLIRRDLHAAQQLKHTHSIHMTVLVYRGEGAGWRSVCSTRDSIERLLHGPLRPFIKPLKVDTVSQAELLAGSWAQTAQTAMLVMPGGADLPYCKHLNGRGNSIIKEFVRNGGSYLGLCAGAYYGCSRVEFEPGTPLEVVGDRELAFFPGIARGAAFAGFDYRTEAGAVAAEVEFSVPEGLAGLALQHQEQQQQLVLAHAQLGPAGAAQQHKHAAVGRTASQQATLVTTHDYCNGGPFFTAPDGDPCVDQLPGVTVLAQYCRVPLTPTPAASLQQQPASQQQQQQQQQQFARRVAAVRCSVGKGVAVLCGTHPELGPQWLDPCGESNAQQGPQPAAASIPPPPQQQQQQQGSSSSAVQVLLQDAVGSRVAAATVGGSGSGLSMPVVCRDAVLAMHAQQLQAELQAAQSERDLLLASLLYEALVMYRRV